MYQRARKIVGVFYLTPGVAGMATMVRAASAPRGVTACLTPDGVVDGSWDSLSLAGASALRCCPGFARRVSLRVHR